MDEIDKNKNPDASDDMEIKASADSKPSDPHKAKRRKIDVAYKTIADGGEAAEQLPPFKTAFFKQACEYLGDSILSRELLKSKLDQYFDLRERMDKSNVIMSRLKTMFKHGSECFLLVSPTIIDVRLDFRPELVEKHAYFYAANVYKDEESGTKLTDHVAYTNGQYAKVFPEEMRSNCSFNVEWNKDEDGNVQRFMTAEEFVRFNNAYIDAFNELRKFFALEPLSVDDLRLTTEQYEEKAGFVLA